MARDEKPESIAYVTRIDSSFFEQGPLSKWLDFAHKIGMSVSTDKDETDVAAFSALPENPRPGEFYLLGGFHSSAADGNPDAEVHWHLDWRQIPEGPPPKEFMESSERVGGYPGVIARMRDHWPMNTRYVSLSFTLYISNTGRFVTLTDLALRGNTRVSISAGLPSHLEAIAWHGLGQLQR